MPEASRQPASAPRSGPLPAAVLACRELTVRAARRTIVEAVSLAVAPGEVLCLVGPSGAGKTTLLRSFNRLVDLDPELRVSGQVYLRGEPTFAAGVDVDALRAQVGMLFQQPVIFPGSIALNVLFGARGLRRRQRRERLETALRRAALWEEVGDRLEEPADALSVGQQQRLCLARVLALEPEVLLMDEPTSALDPRATRAIESLIRSLRGRHTQVVVTHDLEQARRIADRVACLCVEDGVGRLLEVCGPRADFDRLLCWESCQRNDREPP